MYGECPKSLCLVACCFIKLISHFSHFLHLGSLWVCLDITFQILHFLFVEPKTGAVAIDNVCYFLGVYHGAKCRDSMPSCLTLPTIL